MSRPSEQNAGEAEDEVYSPETAVSAGFLDRVVPGPDLLAAARETADALGRLDLAAHAATKARARRDLLAALGEGSRRTRPAMRARAVAQAG